MAEYRLTPAAERDLEKIWRYTQRTWGIEQAGRYIDTLNSAFAELAQHPQRAPACDHIRRGYRMAVIESHVIYFRIAVYGADIIRVLHERIDAPRRL